MDDLAREGKAILRLPRSDGQDDGRVRALGRDRRVPVPIVNATAHWSDVGEAMLEKYPEAPFVGAYFEDADGARRWSLRSRPDFDVSEVCDENDVHGVCAADGTDPNACTRLRSRRVQGGYCRHAQERTGIRPNNLALAARSAELVEASTRTAKSYVSDADRISDYTRNCNGYFVID